MWEAWLSLRESRPRRIFLLIACTLQKKKGKCFWSQSPWSGPELMSLNRDPQTEPEADRSGESECRCLTSGRRMWTGQPHLKKNQINPFWRIHFWPKIPAQTQNRSIPYSLFHCHQPSACSCLSGKPTGYKHGVPGSRGQEQPDRHLDLPPGLMTSRSIGQELFKARNRSPGALNINKYWVDWFLPCFSKGSLLPGLSLQ